MLATFVHHIDPVLGEVGGFYLWWYGLGYALGFLEIHFWLRRVRPRLGFTVDDVDSLSLAFALGVLVGGRGVEVIFYEWPFYRVHWWLIPAAWLGGMATHGILLGALVGTAWFCRRRRRNFWAVLDELVIPGALLMGLGRIGNFIDGQILGSITTVPWAVKFPDAEGFRHPVVLYDGLKNLLLIPFLLWIRRGNPPRGVVAAQFIFWYGFLRIFVDLFREYPTTLLGLATGQGLNLLMTLAGAGLLAWFYRRPTLRAAVPPPLAATISSPAAPWWQPGGKRLLFLGLVLFSLTLPSDWTQDIPRRYGQRHPGLEHSWLYPPVP